MKSRYASRSAAVLVRLAWMSSGPRYRVDHVRYSSRFYLLGLLPRLLGRWERADAAAVFSALVDRGFERTLAAAEAAFLPITRCAFRFGMATILHG